MDDKEIIKSLIKENKRLSKRLRGTEKTLEEVRKYLREMLVEAKK